MYATLYIQYFSNLYHTYMSQIKSVNIDIEVKKLIIFQRKIIHTMHNFFHKYDGIELNIEIIYLFCIIFDNTIKTDDV